MIEAAQGTAAAIERDARSSGDAEVEAVKASAVRVGEAITSIETILSEVKRAVGQEHDALRAKTDRARLQSAPTADSGRVVGPATPARELEPGPAGSSETAKPALVWPARPVVEREEEPREAAEALQPGEATAPEVSVAVPTREAAEERPEPEAAEERPESRTADEGSEESVAEVGEKAAADEAAAPEAAGEEAAVPDPRKEAAAPEPTEESAATPKGATAPAKARSADEDDRAAAARSADADPAELEREARSRVAGKTDLELADMHEIASTRAKNAPDAEKSYWEALLSATVDEAVARPTFGEPGPGENVGSRRAKKLRAGRLRGLSTAREAALERSDTDKSE